MSKPTPGSTYTVVKDDQLRLIAAQAYGRQDLWRRIFAANQTTLKSGDPNLIFPGEVLIIPGDPVLDEIKEDLNKDRFSNKDRDKFTVLLGGEELTLRNGSLVLTMDTVADGATSSMAWLPGKDKALDKKLLPYTYPKALVYLGNELQLTGFMYAPTFDLGPNASAVTIEMWSKTADFIDSMLKPPYEVQNNTVLQRADTLARNVSIRAILDDGVQDGGKFDRMTAGPTETNFAHIQKYAAQRSLLLSSTPSGNLLLTKAKVKSKSIGTLQEEEFNVQKYTIKFDGRKRFNTYKAIGQSPGGVSKTQVSKDDKVPRSRFFTFKANDTTQGDQKNAADWRRNQEFAKTMTIPIPVSSWYGPDGKLWKPNTIVTVVSKTLFVPNGFDFLIRQVEYNFDDNGTDAILSLVPPQAYTNEKIVDPWEVSA